MIDDTRVWTGSFNWSYSAEYEHIENTFVSGTDRHPKAVARILANHRQVFEMGRDGYQSLIRRVEDAIKSGTNTDCRFEPMALPYEQMDYLLDTGRALGRI